MRSGYETDEEDSFREYQRTIRGRAADTIDALHQSLRSPPTVSPAQRRHARARKEHRDHLDSPSRHSPSSGWMKTVPTEHADYSYGAAVDRLRTMLHESNQAPKRKNVQFSQSAHSYSVQSRHSRSPTMIDSSYQSSTPPPPASVSPLIMGQQPAPRGEVPSAEETLPLLQNQSKLLQQVEAENAYCKEEMVMLKQKLRDLLEENQALHEELKRTVVHEIIHQGDSDAVPMELVEEMSRTQLDASTSSQTKEKMTKHDYAKWRTELERVNALHAAKTSRLEAQLKSAKEDVERTEQEIIELRTKLRIHESMITADHDMLTAGLCVRCGQNEAVLPSALANHQQTIERITKERDSLMSQLTSLQRRVTEMKHREDEAYLQVKKSVEMVEQAQLEQTQALVQREQLKEELTNMKTRMEEHTESMIKKLSEEREITRIEYSKERELLNKKLQEVTETLTHTQLELDRVTRDKVNLMAELENAKETIHSFDADYNKAADSMRFSMTNSGIERDACIRELRKAKQEIERLDKEHEQEKHRLKTELSDVRRRLDKAERELVEAKEECIHLTTNNQALEREAHIAKLGKESVERNRSDDMKAIQKRAEHRESELNMLIDSVENKHAITTQELEDLLNSQGGLTRKMQEECRKLTKKLEDVTKKYKGDNKNLKTQNDQLKIRLDKAQRRLKELEDQNGHHGRLQEKMRARLRQMDEHAHCASTQILELLSRESALQRDRQLLAKEVEFLRFQFLNSNEDVEKLYSSRRHVIDDILNSVRTESDSDKKVPGHVPTNIPQPNPVQKDFPSTSDLLSGSDKNFRDETVPDDAGENGNGIRW